MSKSEELTALASRARKLQAKIRENQKELDELKGEMVERAQSKEVPVKEKKAKNLFDSIFGPDDDDDDDDNDDEKEED